MRPKFPVAHGTPSSRRGSPRPLSNEVRIIGGQWKRTKLRVIDQAGLRPTPDRVRETLFNWLGPSLEGWRCLDAFAGTGALGFEAASRGAAQVLLVEQDRSLIDQLQAVKARLQAATVRIERGDAISALQRQPVAGLDLVFIDPPFDSDLFAAALQAGAQALTPDGRIYLEAPQAWNDAGLSVFGLCLRRYLKAGAVHAHLLQRQS